MAVEGTYLVFRLDEHLFCLHTGKVEGIIEYVPLTPIPLVPDYAAGAFSHMHETVSVLSVRKKLQFADREDRLNGCFILTRIDEHLIGLWVDGVEEVIESSQGTWLTIPEGYHDELFQRMWSAEERLILELDANALYQSDTSAFDVETIKPAQLRIQQGLEPEPEPEPEPERIEELDDNRLVYIDAIKLKRSFLRSVFWRATTKLGLTQPKKMPSNPIIIEVVPEEINLDVKTSTPIPEKQAEENVKAFYGHVLKRALDTLEETSFSHLSLGASDSFDMNEDTHQESQVLGMRIKNQYFVSILQKANMSLSL